MNDLKKAIEEQKAADKILTTLDRVQHFKMLEKKFGPRNGKVIYVYEDGGNVRYFSQKEFLTDHLKSLAKEAKDLDLQMKDKSLKEIIKLLSRNASIQKIDE